MNDTQWSALRAQPSPEFASRLRATLAQQEQQSAASRRTRSRAARVAASVAIVVATGAALSVPSVRASAQSFLALFREVRFAAVAVDRERMAEAFGRLGDGGVSVERLIGDNVEILEDGGALTVVQSVDEAGALAGYDVRQPAGAADFTVSRVVVAPRRGVRLIANADRLQDVMDLMGIADLTAPRAMNGAAIGIHIPPVVSIKYAGEGFEIEYVQAPTPRLDVPDTVDVRALGEIGLRLIGLNPLEARRFAGTIDWTSTLVVPVPPFVEQFEQVSVNGHDGLFMRAAAPDGGGPPTTILVWSAGGRVYMLTAEGVSRGKLLEMAGSIRVTPVIETAGLRREFGATTAVADLSLTVAGGEIFGFLGPNGAGKTTSIKMLLGLVAPTSGRGTVLGAPLGDVAARARIGFLPEHFRFHDCLTARELLRFHGRLYGLRGYALETRIDTLLTRVDMQDAADRPLRGYSKGMLQRAGLAQALLNEPVLVFLDEPTSGLDPLGRLLVRDIMTELRARGTTVFLNSHLLGEVEATCDRVTFVKQGRAVHDLPLTGATPSLDVELRLDAVDDCVIEGLGRFGTAVTRLTDHRVSLRVASEDAVPAIARWLVERGARIYALHSRRKSLEEWFVEIMGHDQRPG